MAGPLGNKNRQTHGMRGLPEYAVWQSMIQRCTRPEHKSYSRYGGRGIRVCSRWRSSFEAFIGDMGLRPAKGYCIERSDNNGDYRPGNCVWTTAKRQALNRSNTRRVTHQDRTQSLTDWCDELGLDYTCIARRYWKGKRPPELFEDRDQRKRAAA